MDVEIFVNTRISRGGRARGITNKNPPGIAAEGPPSPRPTSVSMRAEKRPASGSSPSRRGRLVYDIGWNSLSLRAPA
jgi:hypothetical protein